ncbi:GDSL esterase/lipase At1g71250-like isoform X3 [Spinacia oleracea]|uniref:GDSL esterase/lipase At1g71250-like isoform X3 n=1 Tax=Spinacia oleracea TaxID=3562 RepID=A0A9R0J2T9_SPIOL|nr:GDSL esterase/lipase At1g71250-like isoform X3 [Spinacia oleracea]
MQLSDRFRIILYALMTMAGPVLVYNCIFLPLVTFKHTSPPSPSPSPSPGVPFRRAVLESTFSRNTDFINDNSLSTSSMKSPAIFVIGDSTVDCGENALFYHLLRGKKSLVTCSKASKSTLIPHFLAKKMGLPDTPTFYEKNDTIQGLLSGINYGSAQATILPIANTLTFQSLNQQLRQVFETIQLVQLQLGEQEAQEFIGSSVFYLSLGKDDYTNFYFGNSSYSPGYNGGDKQLFPKLLVDEMTNALRNLYNAGVRKVVSMGIYPLGCAPRTVVDWYFHTGRNIKSTRGCVNEINQLISQHNQLLLDHITDLTLELSDAQFVFCDVYQGFMRILSNPQHYGFEETRGACCGTGWHGAASGCDTMEMACDQSSGHVWWDLYNPSEAVNSLLADSVWSGHPLGDICHPLSIRALVNIAS